MCPCDTWHIANGSYEGHMSSEMKFPLLDQTKENKFDGGEKEIRKRKKRKRKRKERKRKEMNKERK